LSAKVWTFRIIGGQEFRITLPQNPPLVHEGRTTVWKLCGDSKVANAVAKMMRTLGAKVEVFTEQEDPTQAAERRKLLGLE